MSSSKIVNILITVYVLLLGVLSLLSTIICGTCTTYMNLYMEVEKPEYKSDDLWLLLALLVAFVAVAWILQRKCLGRLSDSQTEKLSRRIEILALVLVIAECVIITCIFHARLSCDSGTCSNIAIKFIQGDYTPFSDDYLPVYPFQIGFISYLSLFYKLFGIEYLLPLQIANDISVVLFVLFSLKTTKLIFDNGNIQIALSSLFPFLLPLYLYTVYIYGDVPSFGLEMAAIYFSVKFMKHREKWNLLITLVLITISVILKSNTLILVIALSISFFLLFVKEKNANWIFVAALVLVLAIFIPKLFDLSYVKRADLTEFPKGTPKTAWVVMGLQSNDYLENGWYNGFNSWVMRSNDYDYVTASKICNDSIKELVSYYFEHPRTAAKFFLKKYVSMWGEPGYHCQTTLEWYSQKENIAPIPQYWIYGEGRGILEKIMNAYQFLILVGTVLFAIFATKKEELRGNMILVSPISLTVLGGYLFHMIWEANSKYGLFYFCLMVPLAAIGYVYMISGIDKWYAKRKKLID